MVGEHDFLSLLAVELTEKLGGEPKVVPPVFEEQRLPQRWGLVHFTGSTEEVEGNGTVRYTGELDVEVPAGLERVGDEDAATLGRRVRAALTEVLEDVRGWNAVPGGAVYVYAAWAGAGSVAVQDDVWHLQWEFTVVLQW